MKMLRQLGYAVASVAAIIVKMPQKLLPRLIPSLDDNCPQSLTSRQGFAVVSPGEAAGRPYPYIRVNDDGTARELFSSERDYLEEQFLPGDGGRPYVKSRYGQTTPDGRLSGFLRRSHLPRRVTVQPAPPEDLSAERMRELQRHR